MEENETNIDIKDKVHNQEFNFEEIAKLRNVTLPNKQADNSKLSQNAMKLKMLEDKMELIEVLHNYFSQL